MIYLTLEFPPLEFNLGWRWHLVVKMQQRQLDAAHAVVSEDASVFMFFEQVHFMCLMQNHETKLLFVLALLLFFF